MSEKKQPGNVSYAFMDKAEITEGQSIRLAIENLAHKELSIKEGYDDLLAKQEKSLQVIIAHQEKQRAREVERTKQLLLDENDVRKRNKPVYRPRFGFALSRSDKERAAGNDARAIVLQDEQHRIAKVERGFEEARREYLADAVKSLQRHTETFNQSADTTRLRGGMDSQSQNREGYER